MSLPQFTVTSKISEGISTTTTSLVRVFNALITNLTQIFTAILGKVQLDSLILSNIQLNDGRTTIPHTLGRTLSGWKIIRQRGYTNQTIYDLQDINSQSNINLILVSDTAVSVDIEVF